MLGAHTPTMRRSVTQIALSRIVTEMIQIAAFRNRPHLDNHPARDTAPLPASVFQDRGLVPLARLPKARLTAQDWHLVLPVTQACAADLGVAERLDLLAGDLRTVEFGGPYDAVFLGHILHNYAEEICHEIVRRCMSVVAPGGVVVVIEFLAERGRPASIFSWLFSTNIRGTTAGGRSFSAAELGEMLVEAGAQRTEVGGGLPVGFVLGYRA